MKSGAVMPALLLLAVTSASAAGPALTPIATPQGAPKTVSAAVAQVRSRFGSAAIRTQRRAHVRPSPNVIEYETADFAFIIPAAGSVQGAAGTYFRSDVTFGNFTSAAQNIGVGWLVSGQDNSHSPMTFFSMPPHSITMMNDFVGTTLHKSGLGSLLVIAYDTAGTTVDDGAIIDGFSRIWTRQAGVSSGTVSQSFPAVSLQDSIDDYTAFAIGLRLDSSFRTNVGVVNLDTATHTWTVTSLSTGATTTITVPPFSLGQTGLGASFAGSDGSVAVTFDVNATNIAWSAYATSVDNVTGDGWVSRATQ